MTTVPVAAIAWNDRIGPSATCWRSWYRSRNPLSVMVRHRRGLLYTTGHHEWGQFEARERAALRVAGSEEQ